MKKPNNTWMKDSLDTHPPGELVTRTWLLYAIALGLLIMYIAWEYF